MTFDIVLVLYNSAAWLPVCLGALSAVEYPKSDLHLILVDNASADAPGKALDALREKLGEFAEVQLCRNTKNRGFGAACNQGAALGTSENILFLNVDTEASPALFSRLEQAIAAAPEEVAAFECRQLPYETGHHIDPVSLYTTWATAAALAVRRRAFEEVGGFDERLFMYCEDVDLSWRLRAAGYILQYVPAAQVFHYSYLDAPGGKTAQMKLSEYAGSFYGNLLLRYKFGTVRDIVKGHFVYLGALRRPLHFENVRRIFAKNYLRHFIRLWPFLFWRWRHRCWYKAHTGNFDGGFSPDRGHYRWRPLPKKPLVSVVVYGLAAQEALADVLQSLQNQTYAHFEIWLPDCGEQIAEDMARQFPGLAIRSLSLKEQGVDIHKVIRRAQGKYVCFLGAGQYFYPDHIELMLLEAEDEAQRDIVSAAFMDAAPGAGPDAMQKTDVAAWCKDARETFPLQCLLLSRASVLAAPPASSARALSEYLRKTVDFAERPVDISRATTLIVAPPTVKGTAENEM